jgi:flagellar hook assembly protein FlgD
MLELDLSRRMRVEISIYDLRGRRVRRLVDDVRDAGTHRVPWDGVNDTGVSMASGVYFVRLSAEGRTDMRKVVLLK